jgi:hypothetical protein
LPIAFIDTTGARGRKGGSRAESVWKRETGGERGALAWRSAAGLWPTGKDG